MKNLRTLFMLTIFIFSLPLITFAQTGGTYDLSHNVIAGGGGSNSAGGQFSIDGTIGQALAGTLSTGGSFNLRGGFWTAPPLNPTAALASITGRVNTSRGRGIIRRVRITLTDTFTGLTRSTQTNGLGTYRFEELEVGHFYTIRAGSKNFVFSPDSFSFELFKNLDEVDFTGERIFSVTNNQK